MKSITGKIRGTLEGSRLRRNSVQTVARFAGAALAQLITVALVARELGPEGNGQYAMAVLIPAFMVNFLNLGVGQATVYYLARGSVSTRQVTAESVRLAILIAAVGVSAGIFSVSAFGEQLFPGVEKMLLLMGIAAFPMALLAAYFRAILQAHEDFSRLNLATMLPPCATMVCVVLALPGLGLGSRAAVLAFVAGQTLGAIAAGFGVSRTLRSSSGSGRKEIVKNYWKRALQYGWKVHLSNVLTFVNYRGDIFLVNFFITPFATGLYVVAVQIAEKAWLLSRAVSTVVLPRFAAMSATPLERVRLARKVALAVTLATALAALLAAIALRWLLSPVFGAKYMALYAPFLLLLPGVVVGAGGRVLATYIAASGYPEWNMYVALLVVFLNIGGNIFLIPVFGMEGAAVVSSCAYTVDGICKLIIARRVASGEV